MALRHGWYGCVCLLLGVFCTILPADARASSSLIPSRELAITEPLPLPAVASQIAIDRSPISTQPAAGVAGPRGLLVPMYVSFAALQVGDIFTTRAALSRGAREGNPVMAGLVGNTAAFTTVKIGSSIATIYLAEKVRKRNRVAAYVLMAALDGTYAAIVWHNSRAIRGTAGR